MLTWGEEARQPRDLIVFMDTKPTEPTASGQAEEPGTGSLLYWPVASEMPDPSVHFLKVISTGQAAGEASAHYFVTLDADLEAKGREEFARKFGATLRHWRGERSRNEVASYLGRHPNTIAKFERGDAMPDAWELVRLSRLFGCHLGELFGEAAHVQALQEELASEFVVISSSRQQARDRRSGHLSNRFAFRRSWLEFRGLRPEFCEVATAESDSMETTVREGDILLVDTSITAAKTDGIYLLEQAGERRCKRIQPLVDGGLSIRSDNPKYETEVVSAEHVGMLRICGRVAWIGGER